MSTDMSQEERLEFAEKNCQCYRCPTYIDARPKEERRADIGDKVVKTYEAKSLGAEEIAYCLRGKSAKITKRSSCNCTGTGFTGCPVRMKFKFRNTFYCMEGSETEQACGEKTERNEEQIC